MSKNNKNRFTNFKFTRSNIIKSVVGLCLFAGIIWGGFVVSHIDLVGIIKNPVPSVEPVETASPTPTPTVKPTATPTAKPTPTVKPTPTATPTPTPTPTPTIKPTPTPTPTPTVKPTPTPTPTPKPSLSTEQNLMLVNKDILLPDGYVPELWKFGNEYVDARIYENLKQMVSDANTYGGSLWVASGYRSVELQQALLERAIKDNLNQGMNEDDAKSVALETIAPPGGSEHHTGLCIDFNYVSYDFQYSDVYYWLSANAENYGFVQRYKQDKEAITKYNYEPWHWRYVGIDAAKEMNALNMCLEEYVQYKN